MITTFVVIKITVFDTPACKRVSPYLCRRECKTKQFVFHENSIFTHLNFYNFTFVDENTDKLAWILDVTVAYSEGKPLDLPTIIMGQRKACRTHMYYRLFPSSIVRQNLN